MNTGKEHFNCLKSKTQYFIYQINKMKNLKISSLSMLVVILALAIAGCNGGPFCMAPKGDNVTVTIPVPEFQGVQLDIASNVIIHKGDVQEVKITGAQNIIDNIERNVVDGVWRIKFDDCVRKEGDLSIEITIPELKEATIAGSGSITGTDTFVGAENLKVSIAGSGSISLLANATHVETSIAGSGDINLYTQAQDVHTSIAGSGDTHLRGLAGSLDAEIAGSGSIFAFDLFAQSGSIKISGSGNCEINAAQNLNVTITGSGNVRYKGTPTINVTTTGSGTVQHVD
jgi:hypothetical protein